MMKIFGKNKTRERDSALAADQRGEVEELTISSSRGGTVTPSDYASTEAPMVAAVDLAELKRMAIRIIADLNEDGLANPEYLRGQVEFACELIGYDGDSDELRAELDAAADLDVADLDWPKRS